MGHSLLDYVWLCLSAFLAGGINALAGGGTLLTFPTLISVLSQTHALPIAAVLANGTSTVSLVPASLGSSWGFRREVYELRQLTVWLILPSLLGGGVGAVLLVSFPNEFSALVPWLLFLAATLFTVQPYVSRRLAAKLKTAAPESSATSKAISAAALARMAALQFFISIYGGYFGAGIGIMMLSGLAMMGLTNMHQMNGLKSVLGTTINGIAALIFIATRTISWPHALAMMVTSLLGGFLAAHYSRRIDSRYVRWLVIGIGFGLAFWYFAQRASS
jgi:uncharacterized membrane protein YfcA